jgi:hypothetical protein
MKASGRNPCVVRSYLQIKGNVLVQVTIEFYRIRPGDDAHATLDRITQIVPDLDGAKVRAKLFFETLDMPQTPDGLPILDNEGTEVFAFSPGDR